MRKQPIRDLHDYLDVHRSIGAVVERLRSEVAAGTYRPREAEVVTLEKRLGIPRRLVVPSASDAVVLQAIVEYIEARLLDAAPTSRAYYGRSHQPDTIKDVDESFPYAWWLLWPAFQEQIWGFAQAHDWVVMTDVANYFDSIPLGRLRNRLSALGRFDEEVMDFLFQMLEAFVWRPTYIPFSGVGLPQIDFDAPRLLAHTYLYDVDEFLDRETGGAFVRWMDDIDFGVPSRATGKRLLGMLDSLMAAHGVRINAGKTRVVSGQEALEYLWMDENRRLTLLSRLLENAVRPSAAKPRVAEHAWRRFKAFYRGERHGVWDKVLKRYLTLFAKTGHPGVSRYVADILQDYPDARKWILTYLGALGYSPPLYRALEDFVLGDDCSDDVSTFGVCRLITEWSIPLRSPYRRRAVELGTGVARRKRDRMAAFAGGLWLTAKYGSQDQLAEYLQATVSTWRRSEWGARQVAAATPLLRQTDARLIRSIIRRNGLLDGLAVLADIDAMQVMTKLDRQLSSYLTHADSPFTLCKLITTVTVLDGVLDHNEAVRLRTAVAALVTDPVYRSRLAL